MAYLLETSDSDVIHATTHGMLSRDDLAYLRDRVESAARTATGFAGKYLNIAKESLAKFDFNRLRDRVDSMRERFGRRWDEDRIVQCETLEDFQQAKAVMRPLLMAYPRVRKLYYAQRCDGYEGLWEDDEPGQIGRDHTTYREIMNGSYDGSVADEDRFVTYCGVADEKSGDEKYTKTNKDVVRMSWAQMSDFLDQGKQDPVSALRKTL